MIFLERASQSIIDFMQPRHGRMRAVAGDFGIEIECEGEGNFIVELPGWSIHNDNSLRGPKGIGHGGVEYITNGPIRLEQVVGNVERLRDAIRGNGGVLRMDSPRTSTHIHVNMQQEKLIDVIGCLVVFAAIEPLFLHQCGPYRDGNSFCQPSFDSGDLSEWVHNMGTLLLRKDPTQYDFPPRGKYASLGLHRLHDLGTIECRTFPCSMDPAVIHRWCTWLYNLRNFVRNQTDKSFRQTVKLGLHDPMALSDAIFGPISESRYLAAELIEYGCQEAYELTRILRYWINKKQEEKPKRTGRKSPDVPTLAQFVANVRAREIPMPNWRPEQVVDDVEIEF